MDIVNRLEKQFFDEANSWKVELKRIVWLIKIFDFLNTFFSSDTFCTTKKNDIYHKFIIDIE